MKKEDFIELTNNLESHLEVVNTTSERSGYPKYLAKAIIGFQTYKEAEEFANKNDLSLIVLKKRDGWQQWYRDINAYAFKEFDLFGVYNEDNICYVSDTADDFLDYAKDVIKEYIEDSDFFFIDVLKKIVDSADTTYTDIINMTEDDFAIVDFNETDGFQAEILKRYSMSYYEDVYTYTIGAVDMLD